MRGDGPKILFLVILYYLGQCQASDGDRQKKYQSCLRSCRSAENCDRRPFSSGQSFINKLLGWDCDSECKYRCMWIVEDMNREDNKQARQYYGKWPFRRILGVQELGSSLFSLGNLLANVYGYYWIYNKSADPTNWFMHGVVKLAFFMAVNAWFWSMVFHARDVQFTMILDYVSALALIFTNLALCVFRVFHVRDHSKQKVLAFVLAIYYLRHIYYMLFVKFNFGWNMQVAITSFVFYLILFSGWSASHLLLGKRPHVKTAIAACVLMMTAAVFEVFDFPPLLDLIDAHALWHAATIPMAVMWYRFYRDDADYDLGLSQTVPPKVRSSPRWAN